MANTGYTAKGTHNDSNMSAADKALIESYKAQWSAANAANDAAGKEAAHKAAEAVRAKYGYSGGADGSEKIVAPTVTPAPTYTPTPAPAPTTTKKSYETYNTLGEKIDNASKNATADQNTDYSLLLKEQIASGADYDTVYNTLLSRINKANSTPGLEQYSWDTTTRDAIDYLLTFHETPNYVIDGAQAAQVYKDYWADVAAGKEAGTLDERMDAIKIPKDEFRAMQDAAAAAAKQPAAPQVHAPVTRAPVASTPTVVTPTPTPSDTPSNSSDGEDYLKQMYEAKKEAGLAALKAAYDKNVTTVDAAGKKIPGVYDSARNRAAASAAQAQRNFNQQAAATGLGSGTSAQAQLANSVALQGNLNEINTAESNALAELELQRTNLDTEYQNAIVEANANGNYELAAALYQEKVRVDELLAAQEKAYQQEQQRKYNEGLEMAQYLFKNSGDASGLRSYGYTEEQIAALENQWKIDNTPKKDNTEYNNTLANAEYIYKTTGNASLFAQIPGYTPDIIASMEEQWRIDNTPKIDNSASEEEAKKSLDAAKLLYDTTGNASALGKIYGYSPEDIKAMENMWRDNHGYDPIEDTPTAGSYYDGIPPESFNYVLNNIESNLRQGRADVATSYMDSIAGLMSPEQEFKVVELFKRYDK